MTRAAIAAGPTLYCTKCGRPSPFYAATLDPAYPLVSCSWRAADGEEKGCGIKPGSADQLMVEAIVAENRRKRVTANHHWHVRAKRPNPYCDECRVDPPHPDPIAHPFEEFSTKYRIGSHLEFVHHNRDLHTRLPMRTKAELNDHHRRLHG